MSRSSAGLQVEGNYRAQLNVTRCEKLETGASCPGAAGGSQGHVGGMSRRSPGNQRLPSTLASPIPGKMCGRSVGSVTCQRRPGWLERCSRSLRIPVLLGRRLPAPSGSFSSCFPPLCPPEAGDPLLTLSRPSPCCLAFLHSRGCSQASQRWVLTPSSPPFAPLLHPFPSWFVHLLLSHQHTGNQ